MKESSRWEVVGPVVVVDEAADTGSRGDSQGGGERELRDEAKAVNCLTGLMCREINPVISLTALVEDITSSFAACTDCF